MIHKFCSPPSLYPSSQPKLRRQHFCLVSPIITSSPKKLHVLYFCLKISNYYYDNRENNDFLLSLYRRYWELMN